MAFRLVTKAKPETLPDAAVTGIILHWSAGRYGQHFSDYHFSVAEDGRVYQNTTAPPGVWTAHCWRRNTGNIGICAAAMFGATSEDYGEYPITRYQIESMAALCARLMRRYDIPLANVLTHAEAAELDGYPGERWDLLNEGAELKRKIAWYLKRNPVESK